MEKILVEYISSAKTIYKNQKNMTSGDRVISVGCSELYDAVNTSISQYNIIAKKVLQTELKERQLVWGKIFEQSSKRLTELMLGCVIYNMPGSIKHPEQLLTCSPDGVGIVHVPFKVFINMLKIRLHKDYICRGTYTNIAIPFDPCHIGEAKTKAPVLFEFKSPYSKRPDDNIDRKYLFQVLGGLETIPITQLGILSKCLFRICKYDSYPNSECFDPDGVIYYDYTYDSPKALGCKLLIVLDKNNNHTAGKYKNIDGFEFIIDSNSDVINEINAFSPEYFVSNLTYAVDYKTIDLPMVYYSDGSYKLDNKKVAASTLCKYGYCFDESSIIKLNNFELNQDLSNLHELYDIYLEVINSQNTILKASLSTRVISYIPYKLFEYKMFYINKIHDLYDAQKGKIAYTVSSIRQANLAPEPNEFLSGLPKKARTPAYSL